MPHAGQHILGRFPGRSQGEKRQNRQPAPFHLLNILSIDGFIDRSLLNALGVLLSPKLSQHQRSIIRYSLWVGGLLIAVLSAADGIALAFLIQARTQSEALSDGALPRAIAAERLAVDASHLTALTDELPGAASVAERQTVMQRIDGLRAGLAADLDMLKKAGLTGADLAALSKAQADLLEGADAMNGVAQSGIDLESELSRQRDRAWAGCEQHVATPQCQQVLWALAGAGQRAPVKDDQPELRAVAVLQRDIAVNEQHRVNLLRRQSEMASRFLALAGAQSEVAAEEMRRQQQNITAWVARLEWGLGATLIVTVAALIRLRIVARRRLRHRA
jgi:hypothetical protein